MRGDGNGKARRQGRMGGSGLGAGWAGRGMGAKPRGRQVWRKSALEETWNEEGKARQRKRYQRAARAAGGRVWQHVGADRGAGGLAGGGGKARRTRGSGETRTGARAKRRSVAAETSGRSVRAVGGGRIDGAKGRPVRPRSGARGAARAPSNALRFWRRRAEGGRGGMHVGARGRGVESRLATRGIGALRTVLVPRSPSRHAVRPPPSVRLGFPPQSSL